MHFESKKDAIANNFTAKNPFSENNVTLIIDYSHNKKTEK